MGELRHSFVAIAQRGRWITADGTAGLSLADVAEVTGHRSSATTSKFYNVQLVPRMLVVPLALAHPADPPLPQEEKVDAQPGWATLRASGDS
jgi:hypothetical protein